MRGRASTDRKYAIEGHGGVDRVKTTVYETLKRRPEGRNLGTLTNTPGGVVEEAPTKTASDEKRLACRSKTCLVRAGVEVFGTPVGCVLFPQLDLRSLEARPSSV